MGIGLFKRTVTLDNLKEPDIAREKQKLEVEEEILSRELRVLEAQSKKKFADAASSKASSVEDRRAARDIVLLKAQTNDRERQAADISQKIMALDRLHRAKQRRQELEEKGLWRDIAKMPVDDLAEQLTTFTLKDETQRDRIERINTVLGIDESSLRAAEPAEFQSVLESIQSARESGHVSEEYEKFSKKTETESR